MFGDNEGNCSKIGIIAVLEQLLLQISLNSPEWLDHRSPEFPQK